MRPSLARAAAMLLAGSALLSGGVAVAQKSEALPPYVAAYTPNGVEERGIWMESDEAERKLADSSVVIRDPELNAYLRRVLCNTVGADRCEGVRIYPVQVPFFNATMHPNGMLTIYSGLLLRMRNESELGAALGHEFAHFELRHTLDRNKNARSTTDALAWMSILGPAGSILPMALVGSLFAFNRAQETEADLQALKYLAASDYSAGAAANIWERLMAEADATAIGRKRKAKQRYAAGFFASHPTELNRATYLREAAIKANDTGTPSSDSYKAAMAKWMPRFLVDQIKLNDFGGTEYLLSELAKDGWTADLLYARAELYRERGLPRDLVSAAQFYREAIDQGMKAPEAHRGLGLALLRAHQVEEGRAALRDYLNAAPGASDAAIIKTLVTE